ncbi:MULTISPECIES: glycosyltransferase family 4 protein [Paraburkholderia]|uniref:glycosyltransferase family 4 protein n=1 Tax=Paraburkholderia TaxID=1822464 RepID=UPI0003A39A93|nr:MULTISPECIES: glycosyltransferase family 1 protein [Paraburkholderia]MDH6147168.1 glycosyltransferase involved in cell wall biosynthesis [Paraburkholderia sp. WSM4179]
MLEKHNSDAQLDIAMGGRALLTPLTGIGQYASHLAREFVQLGHSVRFFYGTHWSSSSEGGGASPSAGAMGMRSWRTVAAAGVKRFARKYLPGTYRFMPHVEQHRFDSGIRRQRAPQIYHDPNFIPFRFRGPTVITAHDVSWVRYPEYHPAPRLALLRANFPRALERADRVIVVSDFVRDELQACFPVASDKIKVVQNGVSTRFQPHSSDTTRDVLNRHGLVHGQYFAAVGTLEPRKNLHTALAAHARLPAAVRRRFPLTLIGVDGWLTDSLDVAIEPGLREGTVRKLGYVSDDEIPLLTAGALAIVYPSVYEGFGLPVVEAMASGVPVLCSTAQALREVAGDACIMRDPADVDGFTEAMQALLDDGALRDRLIAAGSTRARCFSWQRTADETLAVYRQIVA